MTENDEPVPHAVVIVVPPPLVAADYLSPSSSFLGRLSVVRIDTDGGGKFRHEIEIDDAERRVSITAAKPGYYSARPRWFRGGDPGAWREIVASKEAAYFDPEATIRLTAGRTTNVAFRLNRGRLITGVIQDHAGNPFAETWVFSKTGERTITDSLGRFAATSFENPAGTMPREDALKFQGPEVMPGQQFLVPVEAGTNLQIVLSRGYTLSGRILDSTGGEGRSCIVEARFQDASRNRIAKSNTKGEYTITGLSDGAVTLFARSETRNEHVIAPLDIRNNLNQHNLRLVKSRQWDVAAIDILGVELVKLTTAVNDHYRFADEPGKERGCVVQTVKGGGWSLSRGAELVPGDIVRGVMGKKISGWEDPHAFVRAVIASIDERESNTIPITVSRFTGEQRENVIVIWTLTAEEINTMRLIATAK